MQQRRFAERFLEHLGKIDPSEVESFILRTVRERDLTARIFETLTEGIVVCDSDGQVALVNKAARRILRWGQRQRVVGESLLDLLEAGPLRDLVETFAEERIPIQDQEALLRPRARKVYNVNLLPIEDLDGEEPEGGAALILQDLTSPLNRQERDAQARNLEYLATLTAGVAHDIKNPLNSLSIHAQLLEREAKEIGARGRENRRKARERIAHSCTVIGEEVERLRKCVDDLIDAARPRHPLLQATDLNTIVRSVVRMARMEFESQGIRIETFLDPDLPALQVDERQMIRLLRNLLRNAAEAIDTARRPARDRRITFRTAMVEDSAVSLEISDTGCGIPEAEMPRLFEPYYTTKFSGSGLGLMAVGRIIREHGGEISVQSTEGEGTAFTIELPVASRRVRLLESK